jgi:DNA uptake protein ComE-like DNA-binding protein
MIENASGVDLNNASAHELARIGGIGLVLAARIVEHRPFSPHYS